MSSVSFRPCTSFEVSACLTFSQILSFSIYVATVVSAVLPGNRKALLKLMARAKFMIYGSMMAVRGVAVGQLILQRMI
jgi:hypothetical protein